MEGWERLPGWWWWWWCLALGWPYPGATVSLVRSSGKPRASVAVASEGTCCVSGVVVSEGARRHCTVAYLSLPGLLVSCRSQVAWRVVLSSSLSQARGGRA